MLKPLTFSVSLALALGFCSLGMAGHHSILPSGQCEYPSAQAAPSGQCDTGGCGDVCGPVKRKHRLCDLFKHKPKCYTYEWVLKKKRCGGLFNHGNSCGQTSCDTCGVTPSAQWASPQGEYGSPQGAPAAPAGQAAPAAPAGGAVPPPPPPPTAANGGVLFLTPAGN
jgi:hypothetical protein